MNRVASGVGSAARPIQSIDATNREDRLAVEWLTYVADADNVVAITGVGVLVATSVGAVCTALTYRLSKAAAAPMITVRAAPIQPSGGVVARLIIRNPRLAAMRLASFTVHGFGKVDVAKFHVAFPPASEDSRRDVLQVTRFAGVGRTVLLDDEVPGAMEVLAFAGRPLGKRQDVEAGMGRREVPLAIYWRDGRVRRRFRVTVELHDLEISGRRRRIAGVVNVG